MATFAFIETLAAVYAERLISGMFAAAARLVTWQRSGVIRPPICFFVARMARVGADFGIFPRTRA